MSEQEFLSLIFKLTSDLFLLNIYLLEIDHEPSPEKLMKAKKYIESALLKKQSKRDPVKGKKINTTYRVIDGNTTVTVLKEMKIKRVVAQIA